jgi:hypothetical protein
MNRRLPHYLIPKSREKLGQIGWGSEYKMPNAQKKFDSFTYPIYQQLRAQNHVLEDIFAFKNVGRADAAGRRCRTVPANAGSRHVCPKQHVANT